MKASNAPPATAPSLANEPVAIAAAPVDEEDEPDVVAEAAVPEVAVPDVDFELDPEEDREETREETRLEVPEVLEPGVLDCVPEETLDELMVEVTVVDAPKTRIISALILAEWGIVGKCIPVEVETTTAPPVAVLPDDTVVAATAEAVELPSPWQLNPVAQHVAAWLLSTEQ